MPVRASVLIPTHNKPKTLPLTVDTVLRQTVTHLEVVIIGDNVTPEVREVVHDLQERDGRVRFMDMGKAPKEGEAHRHAAVLEANSNAIFYLCDDDLLLPEHVADLLTLLEEHNFVQCRNGYVTPEGQLRHYANDLANSEHVAMHLREDTHYNAVSITGTAHTKAFYEEVGDGWETTPDGEWTDRHQWRKMMRHPSFRGATSRRMTALQFPTSAGDRATWSQEARIAELEPWHALVTSPTGQQRVNELAAEGAIAQLAEQQHALATAEHYLRWLQSSFDAQAEDLSWLREHHARTETAFAEVSEQRQLLEARTQNLSRRNTVLELQLGELKATIEDLRGKLRRARNETAAKRSAKKAVTKRA